MGENKRSGVIETLNQLKYWFTCVSLYYLTTKFPETLLKKKRTRSHGFHNPLFQNIADVKTTMVRRACHLTWVSIFSKISK